MTEFVVPPALIDKAARAIAAVFAEDRWTGGPTESELGEAVLRAVLSVPCETCAGDGVALQFGATRTGDESTCRACGGSGVRFDPLAALGCGPDDLALAVLSATNERVALDADESAAIVEALFARVVSDG